MTSPLPANLLIVEMGERVAAAAAGSLLAELGATVVVIERAGKRPLTGKSTDRATFTAGKQSVALAENDDTGLKLAVELIEKADAVIVSSDLDGEWPPLIAAALKAREDICDITAFSGDSAQPPLSDALMQAVTGIMDTTGDPDSEPTYTRAPVIEVPAGIYAAAGILLTQIARRRQNVRQSMSVALFDSAVSMMTTFLPRFLMGGEPQRIGNHHPSMSPWNAYRANDGWLMVCSGSNDQWKRVATLLGKPELGTDPRFDSATSRVRSNPEIDRMMEEWAGNFTVEECVSQLNRVNIPCGPVFEVSQLFVDESLRHRNMVNVVDDPESGRAVHVPGALFRGSLSRGQPATRIPRLGEDNARVQSLLAARNARQRPEAPAAAKPVLDGMKVIEIGQYTTAPLTARQLGAFGADVVKVEPPGGEPARALPPHRDSQSLFFTLSNSDKRGIILDLRNAADKDRLAELVKCADVLIENMKPGALQRFGFSAAELSRLNPRLIYCAVSGFGTDSPNAALGAMDTTIQGMSGLMDLTRSDGTPFKIGISIADIIGGQLGLTFILAALEERERTGKGQFIDLSMQDAAAWIIRTQWNPNNAAQLKLFACADGFVLCQCEEDLTDLVRAQNRAEAVRTLAGKGFMAAAVQRLSETLKSTHVQNRDIMVAGQSPSGGEWSLLNTPVRLEKTPARVCRAMGPPGCDTDSIVSDWGIPAAHQS